MRRENAEYQALYCEENVWRLVQRMDRDPGVGPVTKAFVAFVSNPERRVALWSQRAGRTEDDGLVVWDYHVILFGLAASMVRVWDLDSRLAFGGSADVYLRDTFRVAPPVFSPRFRLVDAQAYAAGFGSDRSHMRDDQGAYRSPPPPWSSPAGTALPLAQLLDPTALTQHPWMDVAELQRHLAASAQT